ncbi:MAG: ribosome silencing factor [Bacteroidota bacterium]
MSEPENTLTQAIVQGMQAKKAQDICILNLRAIRHAVADYFVICSGSSHRQVEAIAEAIVATGYQQTGERPWQQEGSTAKEWMLLDYGDVIVHVFHPEKRALYALEALWGDAVQTRIAS